MYIRRAPEEMLKLACLAVARKFFPGLAGVPVRQAAAAAGVSEKQVHWWKEILLEKGPALFVALKPGRRKEGLKCAKPEAKPLVYETVNRLLVERLETPVADRGGKPEMKRKLLEERQRLKADGAVTYEEYAQVMGVSSRTLRRWDRRLEQEGQAGLVDRSRAPLRRPRQLHPELAAAIAAAGASWTWRGGEKKDFRVCPAFPGHAQEAA